MYKLILKIIAHHKDELKGPGYSIVSVVRIRKSQVNSRSRNASFQPLSYYYYNTTDIWNFSIN